MSASIVCGSIEERPVSSFEWVIPDILQFNSAQRKLLKSPFFFVKSTPLVLLCRISHSKPNEVRFWLGKVKKVSLEVTHYSINLIAEDGSEHQVCLKRDVNFDPNKSFLNATFDGADGRFIIDELQSKFFPNGSLRIRCQVEMRRRKKDGEKEAVVPLQGSTLIDDLRTELAGLRFSDFKIVCGEREFPAHRVFLASRSPVFKAMFESEDTLEGKTGRAVVKDIEPEAMEALIKFTHTDKVEEEELTLDLLAAADKYQIPLLFNRCEIKLTESLSIDNAADCFISAYLHNANKLKNFAKKFIVDHFDAVKQTPGMTSIVKSHPQALFEILEFACS